MCCFSNLNILIDLFIKLSSVSRSSSHIPKPCEITSISIILFILCGHCSCLNFLELFVNTSLT